MLLHKGLIAMTQFARFLTLPARVGTRPRPAADELVPLSPATVRRGLRTSIIEGMLAQVHISVTSGAILTGLALLLGAGNITLGILAALPLLMQPLQLLSAWAVERQGTRKPVTVGGSLGRLLWLVLILLPYAPWSPTQRLGVLLVTLAMSQALLTMCGNAWTQWMTDLVPARERGRYFGTRNTAMAVIAMGANYLAGWWLDRMRVAGTLEWGYAVVFGIACAFGAFSTLMLIVQPEPQMPARPRMPLRDVLRLPLQHAGFMQFLRANMAWQVALAVAAPFFSAHALSVLNMPFKTLATFDVITAAISILTLPLWGRLADRWGHRRVLLLGMILVLPLPWAWALATPSTLWLLYLNAALSGIGWPAITLSMNNRLMERVPAEARGAYFAVYATLTGVSYFVASTLAGGMADVLANVQLALGPLTINNYALMFMTGSLLRVAVAWTWRKAW